MDSRFDRITPRTGSSSIKWSSEAMQRINGRGDLLPMWIADMDFDCAEPIMKAIAEVAAQGMFGYSYRTKDYFKAITGWFAKRHGWRVDEDWLLYSSGVVAGLNAIIQEFTEPGDSVIVQSPVYHPFFSCILENGRAVSDNALVEEGKGKYGIDFDDLKKRAADPRTKLMLFCNPHNPVGMVWSRDEVYELGRICVDNNVLIVADEIHSDLVFEGKKHTPFMSLCEEFADSSIACTAISKTFNLAGLQTANLIVKNEKIRKALEKRLSMNGIEEPNVFGTAAAIAAYEEGGKWLDDALVYLSGNANELGELIAGSMPRVVYRKPDGTYLAWLDFRAYDLAEPELRKIIVEKAGIAVSMGGMFGDKGKGFVRLNFACPRQSLKDAVSRLSSAFASLGG